MRLTWCSGESVHSHFVSHFVPNLWIEVKSNTIKKKKKCISLHWYPIAWVWPPNKQQWQHCREMPFAAIDHETYKGGHVQGSWKGLCVKHLCGSNSYSEGPRAPLTASKDHQFKFDAGNNDCLYIYSWPCPLINWQNIKGDKRNLRMWKLINPKETPAWLHHVSISRPQKKIISSSVHRPVVPAPWPD